MQRIHIICHPKSGSGRGQVVLEQVIQRLQSYNIPHFTYLTQEGQHIDLITKQVMSRRAQSYEDDILIIGGDGTLHDAIESLHHLQLKFPVAYLPAGTGNDFARVWLKGRSIDDVLNQLIFQRKIVDVPIYRYHNHYNQTRGIVLNSLGFGLDALTNLHTQHLLKKLPSFIGKGLNAIGGSYILGLFISLNKIPHFDLTIQNDHTTSTVKNISIATLVNNPYFGAGIQIDNVSKISDAHLNLITYHHIDLSAVLELIPKVLIHHNQDQSDHVTRFTGQHIHLTSPHRVQGQVDGEPFIYDCIDMSFEQDSYPFIGVLSLDDVDK